MRDSPSTLPAGGLRWLTGDGLLWRLLRESVPGQKTNYLIALAAMVTIAAMTAAAAWIMGEIVDAMTDPDQRHRVYLVAAGVAGIFLVKGMARFVQEVALKRAGNRIVAEKQSQLYRKLLGQGVTFFNVTESSDLLKRVTFSAHKARSVIDTLATGFARDLLTLVFLVGVMFYQQPALSLISLIFGPLVILGLRRLMKRVGKITVQKLGWLAEIIKVIQETASGVRVVKAFALERHMIERMDRAVHDVEKRANKIARLGAATYPLVDSLAGVAIAAIVVLSVTNPFGAETTSPGQLMSFVTALLMAYQPAKRLSRMRVSIETGMVGVRMMYELLDQPEPLTERPDAQDIPDGPGAVVLDGVRFAYGPGKTVLDGIDLQFPPGRMTALVGPSGAGKSTILNLIMRMYDPTEGRVLIDGVDLRAASFASLRRKIAFVGQDTFLFSTTVMENLRFGRPDASDAEVIEAAKIAHAHEFVAQMPQGYATQVGENGAFLSGGQRQRIAIARAVLRRAPILLLDEATSALDSLSEALVRDALERITRGVTTIVIAHRISTVLGADHVAYIEAGRVVEEGTLQALLDRGGRFRELFDEQFGAAGRLDIA